MGTFAAAVQPFGWVAGGAVTVGVVAVAVGLLSVRLVSEARQRRRLEHRLDHQATHDPRTSLPNRRWLIDHLDSLGADGDQEAGSVALLLVELADFRRIADSLGSGIGETLVLAVAHRLGCAVPNGSGVAHLGLGEFAVALRRADRDVVERSGRDLLGSLETAFLVNGHDVFLRASIGAAIAPESRAGWTGEDLLSEAEMARRRCVANIENQVVVFDPEMRQQSEQQIEMERDLRLAVEQGQFVVFYQPIVSLVDGSWTGFEALVRWDHPERGLIGPDDFIPLAEETGLIVPIGEYVLREAVRQIAVWRSRDDAELTMSVNLSVRQLRSADVVATVARAMDSAHVPEGAVWIELTESMVIDDAQAILADLRATGIRLAIDDFGTGYSSLSSLQQYPFDRVKIDRAFVHRLGVGSDGGAIVAAVIDMADALGLDCVAEGVETDDQRRRLTELGCGKAQGFLFAKPASAAEIDEVMDLRGRRNATGAVEVPTLELGSRPAP